MRNSIAIALAVLVVAALAAPVQAQVTPGPLIYAVSATVCNEAGQLIEVDHVRETPKEAQTLAVTITREGTLASSTPWSPGRGGRTRPKLRLRP